MRVEWDENRCAFSAMCTALAADVFSIDDDGHVHVNADNCDESQRSSIEAAAATCPTQSIRIIE